MSATLRSILIGALVAGVVAFGLAFLDAAAGVKDDTTPWMIGALIGIFAGYISGNLAGNRKVALADTATRQAALALTAPPGQALIVVYREGFVARAAGLNIAIDGAPFAQLKAPRFTTAAVTPGSHSVTAGFGGLAAAQNAAGSASADLAAGEIAAYRITVSMGLLKNTIALDRETDLERVQAKLAAMPMVQPGG